jgi:hypothetical protein
MTVQGVGKRRGIKPFWHPAERAGNSPKSAPVVPWWFSEKMMWRETPLDYFPAQNCATLAFGENHPVGGKLQDRTELNLTSAAAVDSFL